MISKPLLLYASARKESDTRKFVELLFKDVKYDFIDLLDHSIDHYSYNNSYTADDSFLEIMNKVLIHKVIVFATPVYWYSMSGLLKVFLTGLQTLLQ